MFALWHKGILFLELQKQFQFRYWVKLWIPFNLLTLP